MAHIIYPEFFTYCWSMDYFCHDIRRMRSIYSESIVKPFENPEKSADCMREKVWQNPEAYLEFPFDDGDHIDDYYCSVEACAFREYMILTNMQYRTRILWICCIFEMWEQNLSFHMLQDLSNSRFPMTEAQKNNLFNGFCTFQSIFSSEMFDCSENKCILTDFPRYEELRELHLLVNAAKHGRGKSLERLYKDFGKYKISDTNAFHMFDGTTIYSPTLNITDDDFNRFCDVLTDFCTWIPAHILITNIDAFNAKVLGMSRKTGGQDEV